MSYKKVFKIPALPRTEDSKWTLEDYKGFEQRLEAMQHRRRSKNNFPAGYPKTRIVVYYGRKDCGDGGSINVCIRLYSTDIMEVTVTPTSCMIRTHGYNSSLTSKRFRQVGYIIRHLTGKEWAYENVSTPWMTPEQTIAFHEGCRMRYHYDPKTGCYTGSTPGPYAFFLNLYNKQNQFTFRGRRYYFKSMSKTDLAYYLVGEVKGDIVFDAMTHGMKSTKRRLFENIQAFWQASNAPAITHKGVMGKPQWEHKADPIELLLVKSIGVKVTRTERVLSYTPDPPLVRGQFNFFVPKRILKALHDGKFDLLAKDALTKILPDVPARYHGDLDGTFSMREFLAWETNEKTRVRCFVKIA